MYIISYVVIFWTTMTNNKNLYNKFCNINLGTYLLYIRSFCVYMTIMMWWYWFWVGVFIFVDRTIFSIIHVFMYMIICKCNDLWETYLWESRKNKSRFSFMARFKLPSLLGFYSNHFLHSTKYLYHIVLNILTIKNNNEAY
jgi:hypothetical protein